MTFRKTLARAEMIKRKKRNKMNKLQPKVLISTSEIDVNIIQRRTP